MNHSFDDLGPKDHELLWLNDVGNVTRGCENAD